MGVNLVLVAETTIPQFISLDSMAILYIYKLVYKSILQEMLRINVIVKENSHGIMLPTSFFQRKKRNKLVTFNYTTLDYSTATTQSFAVIYAAIVNIKLKFYCIKNSREF